MKNPEPLSIWRAKAVPRSSRFQTVHLMVLCANNGNLHMSDGTIWDIDAFVNIFEPAIHETGE